MASGYVARRRDQLCSYRPHAPADQGYELVNRVSDIAAPVLAEFRREVAWPSDISLYAEDSISLQRRAGIGARCISARGRISCTDSRDLGGQAYLAFCNSAERNQIIDKLAASPDPQRACSTPPDTRTASWRDSTKGFATMHRSYSELEYRGKVWALAVPVRDAQHVYASINILMLKSAYPESEAIKRFLPRLQEVAGAWRAQSVGNTRGAPGRVSPA